MPENFISVMEELPMDKVTRTSVICLMVNVSCVCADV